MAVTLEDYNGKPYTEVFKDLLKRIDEQDKLIELLMKEVLPEYTL